MLSLEFSLEFKSRSAFFALFEFQFCDAPCKVLRGGSSISIAKYTKKEGKKFSAT